MSVKGLIAMLSAPRPYPRASTNAQKRKLPKSKVMHANMIYAWKITTHLNRAHDKQKHPTLTWIFASNILVSLSSKPWSFKLEKTK